MWYITIMATDESLRILVENIDRRVKNQDETILGVSRIIVAGEVTKRGEVVKLDEEQIAVRGAHLRQTLHHQVELKEIKKRVLAELA